MAVKVLNQNTAMGASGPNHAPGFVPDPGPTAGSSKVLLENATFSQLTAADVTNAADVTKANTFALLNTFTDGIAVGASGLEAAFETALGSILLGTVIGSLAIELWFQNYLGQAAVSIQSTTARIITLLLTTVAAVPYQSVALLETTSANFLNASNTVEYQVGVKKNPTLGTIPTPVFAVGDAAVAATLPFLAPTLNAANGASGSISLAKLTTGGANGSITVLNGIITAFTNPT